MNDAPKSDNDKKLNWRKLNTILWICIIILIILILLTTTVAVMKLGNFVPNDVNVFFLVPKEPSFEMGDADGAWSADNALDIFKSEYKNSRGEIVIQSADGKDVIAPGVENEYSFELNNNGNIALDYDMALSFKFTIDGEETSLEEMPLCVRILRNDGTYLAGDDSNWIPVSEMPTATDSGTLGVSSYVGYTLEIKWDFESGDDSHDTYLGNLSCKKDVRFSLDVSTYAEENTNPRAQGGTIDEERNGDVAVGGTIRWFPFLLILLLILLLVAVIIWLLFLKKRKEKEAEA